ncbi:MAG: hypothetical protein OJF60_001256 [Burkholderiaceae bacterium]|jgi:RND family efflux transporter MFP subunit|nr:MAG: hypothetical protein OJF60_001256 [Burkholderiaceae bacterium]
MNREINPHPETWRLPRAVVLPLAFAAAFGLPAAAGAAELKSVTVQTSGQAALVGFDGKVEAVRQAQIAAQVPGAIVELNVRAGDHVHAGQVLLRIDARAAEQGAAASSAQVAAARAQLDVAAKELGRKRQLFEKRYISQAALDQAEASYRAAQAQVNALAAQAGAARTQSGFYVVRAPFDGVVSQLAAERGDMAMPGRLLLAVYDPAALRVSAAVPVTVLAGGIEGARIALAMQAQPVTPVRVQVLPTVDPASLTREVRAELPQGTDAVPGLFARLLLPGAQGGAAVGSGRRLFVPRTAVVRRAEMTGLYVLDSNGAPQLRQVRLGPALGEQVEILSGVDAGERVAVDPQAATRAAAQAALPK